MQASGKIGQERVTNRARPILLYDSDCGICTRLAMFALQFSRGWVEPVGLFTKRGTKIKSEFFSPEDRPDEMFWLLFRDIGYGGRAGILPLARELLRGRML